MKMEGKPYTKHLEIDINPPYYIDTNRGGDTMPITHHTSDFEDEIYQKLVEAQAEASLDPRRLSHDEVFGPLRQKIADYYRIFRKT